MLVGVGIDIVAIQRIRQAAAKSGGRFLTRVFTPGEREYCFARRDPYPSLAARFAAKEAVLKALGRGGWCWRGVEVLADGAGAPVIRLSGGAAAAARARGVSRVLVSLAHEKEWAIAFAVALKGER